MKICKDGRIWGQNNKEASNHLGIRKHLIGKYTKRGYNPNSRNNGLKYGFKKGEHFSSTTEFKKGLIPWNKGTHINNGGGFFKGYIPYSKLHPEIMPRGKEHHFWKGGISSLRLLIRNNRRYGEWRNQVFKRDNYTCQKCYTQRIKIEAHHNKKSFRLILDEFLQEFNQFSPIDDKETLVRLAIKYEPFWDIDNGITYCEECHRALSYSVVN